MLYPTHKKYGILWGLLMIPVTVGVGLIPVITKDMRDGDILLILIAVYMGMRGALFGARFPDIDSPSSIPARRHPYIRKIFEMFRIKHRGKFSHDFVSIGVLFLMLYILFDRGGVRLMTFIADGGQLVYSIAYISVIIFVYMVGLDIVSFFQYIANKTKNKKLWVKLEKRRLLLAGINVLLLMIAMSVGGVVNIFQLLTGAVPLESALMSGTLIVVSFKIYILFAWAGAYSHLFADMTTKSGVSIMGKKLAPAQVILKVRKIPIIGKLLVPTEFKTGSGWENFNNKVVTFLCIPALCLALLVLVGFDVGEIVRLVGK